MATSVGTSNLTKPWAWLAAIAVFCLALATSTALYVVNPAVKMQLPWWAAVAAPALVYGLVLPLCVPRMRMGGWLTGFFTLAVLHVSIALATAWIYARVGFISFDQGLATALWGFPPALVLAMVGSLVMTLPFLGALAPRPAAPRPQPGATPPRPGATKQPWQAPEIVPSRDRQAWARVSAGAEHESAAATAVAQAVSVMPAMAAAPALAEPPPALAVPPPALVVPPPAVAVPPTVVRDEPVVHAAPLSGVNGAAPDTADTDAPAVGGDDLPPVNVPDFRQALSELFGEPATAPAVEETLEAPEELVAPEPSFTAAVAADAPATPAEPVGFETPSVSEMPGISGPVVRIPFDRVVGQLPPGAFRVPLGQVGARLQEAETLVVPLDVVVPQLGEGVVQVPWEVVAEQFPASVFAVAPAEVKERIVNGRLLLPLDEIIRQLPPDVFAASIGRGPVEVPGIEGFPAPFKPLEWQAPPAPAVAEPAPPTPAVAEPVSAPPPAPTVLPEVERAPEPVPVVPVVPVPVAPVPVVPVPVPAPAMPAPVPAMPVPAMPVPAMPVPVEVAQPERQGNAEKLAALMAPWETAAFDEVRVGEFAIISVSAAGLAGSAVAAAAGRLSPVIARRAPRPVEQATLRGIGGTLVLTPVGSGWNTGTALAVGLRAGGPLARLEILARRAAAAHVPASPAESRQAVPITARFDAAPPPPAAAAAAEDLQAFGPLTAQSYREPASGVLIHCFVPPGASAAELAPFAWELAQAMAQGSQAGPLGSFHSAVLRSGRERLEIRRLSSAAGPAPVLVVEGVDTGRPGLARLQVERAAARLGAT